MDFKKILQIGISLLNKFIIMAGSCISEEKNMYFGMGIFFGSFALSQNMRMKFKDAHYDPNPLVG